MIAFVAVRRAGCADDRPSSPLLAGQARARSDAGWVTLAHRVGAGEFGPLPAFDLVITSRVPRALQTAIAMGFAVDEQLDELATMGAAVSSEYRWPQPIGEAVRALLGSGPAGEYAAWQPVVLREIAGRLPDEGAALVISYGGIVEVSAIALLPNADHASWGEAFGYAEGVRLRFEGERCTDVELLRVPQSEYLVEN